MSAQKTKKILITFITALILGAFSSGVVAEEMLKIGFIDFEKVFNLYYKTKDENQKLQRYKEEKEKSAQQLINEINKLKEEAEILSDEAKKQVEKEIKDKLRTLRDYTEDSKKELLDERNVMFQKITDEIRAVIAVKGKKDNFSLILDDKALFYKQAGFDITDEVIAVINDEAKRNEYLKNSPISQESNTPPTVQK